jgi:putative ABC transport system permease protein
MRFRTVFDMAVFSLMGHKLRSFLAMLGIIVGVASMIALLALVRGAQEDVLHHIRNLGVNVLLVRPGQTGGASVVSGGQQRLTPEDAGALAEAVPAVLQAAPVIRSSAHVKFGRRTARTLLIGTTPEYFAIRNFTAARGRFPTPQEVAGMARVAVLGPVPAERLFGRRDPVGQLVKVNGMGFRVVGTFRPKGDEGWFNLDDQVVVPCPIAMRQLLGVAYINEIDVRVADDADMAGTAAAVRERLRRRHRIPAGEPDDFYVVNMTQIRETARQVTGTFTALLAAIAGIALIIGGIGIMNIMLVNVTERTREIGVRKAIGARDRDILGQFLVEALIMSLFGGAVGLALGLGGARLVPLLTGFGTRVDPWAAALALLSSAAVGVFFGYYPARNAARLDPVEALRYE